MQIPRDCHLYPYPNCEHNPLPDNHVGMQVGTDPHEACGEQAVDADDREEHDFGNKENFKCGTRENSGGHFDYLPIRARDQRDSARDCPESDDDQQKENQTANHCCCLIFSKSSASFFRLPSSLRRSSSSICGNIRSHISSSPASSPAASC